MLYIMFKLEQCAENSWRKLRGFAHLADVIQGVDFVNGISCVTLTNTPIEGCNGEYPKQVARAIYEG